MGAGWSPIPTSSDWGPYQLARWRPPAFTQNLHTIPSQYRTLHTITAALIGHSVTGGRMQAIRYERPGVDYEARAVDPGINLFCPTVLPGPRNDEAHAALGLDSKRRWIFRHSTERDSKIGSSIISS